VLELRGLVKHYPTVGSEPVRAVDSVSLAVEPGEFVALFGPSGSGKTTLLKMIAGTMRPDRGEVLVGGRSITGLNDRDATAYRLRELGLVPQASHMIAGLSAIENAALKLVATGVDRREAERSVTPWLERLGLVTRAEHRASDLSMGERQRLALAKALSNSPPLVVADEPTGNLDSARARDVLTLLRNYAHDQPAVVIIATHDPEAGALADRVVTLRDGHLAENGAREQPEPMRRP